LHGDLGNGGWVVVVVVSGNWINVRLMVVGGGRINGSGRYKWKWWLVVVLVVVCQWYQQQKWQCIAANNSE
jgi:hypothetical protein